MTTSQFSLVSSIFTLGGLIGALAAGPTSNKYGRLRTMQLTTITFFLGSVLETLSPNIGVMGTGRVFSGMGAGAASVVVPLYISEVAPPQERGLFGALTQITINLGILITQVLGFFLSRRSLWRMDLAVGGVFALVQAGGLWFVPESPAWLAAHGDGQRAVRTLQRIRGSDVNIDEEIQAWDVDARVDGAPEEEGLLARPASRQTSNNGKGAANIGIFELARLPEYRPALIAVVGVMVAQQLCGINSIMMYSVSLLSTILPGTSVLLAVIISAINFIATIILAPLSDRLGRKTCLLVSIAGMGSMSICMAFSILFSVPILSAISALLFVVAFGAGLGPVPFLLASELVGQEAAGAAQSWALAASWIATFLVAQFFPVVNDALGKGRVYFIFAALAAVFGVFVAWRVPETKGKRDVDDVWGRTRRVD